MSWATCEPNCPECGGESFFQAPLEGGKPKGLTESTKLVVDLTFTAMKPNLMVPDGSPEYGEAFLRGLLGAHESHFFPEPAGPAVVDADAEAGDPGAAAAAGETGADANAES